MHMTTHLQSPPSILSETNSNLWILRDSVFQLNSDFVSNSNPKSSGLLPHPYISLGAPPPRIHILISPQNRTIAATLIPFKLNQVSVVRSPGPNHRKKNHVKTRFVASAIYCRSFVVVSHQAATFLANLKSIWRYRWVPLAVLSLPDFTDLKLEVYNSSYSKFRWTSGEVPVSKLHGGLLPSAPSKFYK
jgi:hypothetical protein